MLICCLSLQFVEIGIVTTLEVNKKEIEFARKGQEVCVKITPIPGQAPKMLGRHFEEKDQLVSKVSVCVVLFLSLPLNGCE